MNDRSVPVFLADRKDGFGGRLNAILNAFAFAERYKSQCKIVWEEKPNISRWHRIESADKVFTQEFIEEFCIERSTISSVIEIEQFLSLVGKRKSKRVNAQFVKMNWQVTAPVKEALGEELLRTSMASHFRQLAFHRDLTEVIDFANQIEIAPGTVAIHLRAGDVIYSFRRYNANINRKAVPYQLAAALVARLREKGKT